MQIRLTTDDPIVYRPRRLSKPEQEYVENTIKEYLDQKIIRPSQSNYASPIVLVDKKNGEKRLCVDYRSLNKITIKDKYPLPLINDQIDKLSSHIYFTTLDLKNGFFHVPVSEQSKKYTKHCLTCTIHNPVTGKPTGSLFNIPKGNTPFVTLHCDHVGPLDKSLTGYRHIFVVIDAYSKFIFLNPTKSTSSKEVTKILLSIFQTFGPSKRIVTDRGTAFTSEEFKDFLKNFNVSHVLNATSTPRANGQCERYNKTLCGLLAKIVDNNHDWCNELPRVQLILNNTFQRSIANSPARILLGYDLRVQTDQALRDVIEEVLQQDDEFDHLEQRCRARETAESTQIAVQQENKQRYDLRRRPPPRYAVGDHVMIKSSFTPGQSKKFQPKFHGPYQITKVLDNDRFVVEDIPGAQYNQRYYQGILSSDRLRLYLPDDEYLSSSSDGSDHSDVDDTQEDDRADRHVRMAEAVAVHDTLLEP